MSTVTTDRPVNVSQLGVELGRRHMHAVGPHPDGSTVVDVPGVGVVNLTAALDAHTADPAWTDPEAPPPEPVPPTTQEQLDALAAALVAKGTITRAEADQTKATRPA